MRSNTNRKLGSKASSPDAAMDALARLLAIRERSVKESEQRLLEKGFSEAIVAHTLKRAEDCGLLDDQRFAKAYIRDKVSANWGRYRIEKELYRFGIDMNSIEGYPDAFFVEEEQMNCARRALRRHHSRSRNPQQAAYRYLIGKGFDSGVVSTVVRNYVCGSEEP